MSSEVSGFTERVAREVEGLSFEQLSPTQIARARHAVLDWLAVTIGGSAEESAGLVQRVVLAAGNDSSATLIGLGRRTSVGNAALANGTAASALALSDNSWWTGGHPGGALLAAGVAVGEATGAGGRALIEALVAGLQGEARIYLASGTSLMGKGFDPAAVVNVFGAAGVCGRLLGLDAEGFQRAYALAATQAAGLMLGTGTMALHLNVGRAAANGVLAAQLAAEGFTAPPDAVEGESGFASAYSVDFDAEAPYAAMGDRMAMESVSFKRYACAGGTHAVIEGIDHLRRVHAFSADDVREVRVLSSPEMVRVNGVLEPRTGAETKFCMPHGAAIALTGLGGGPDCFTNESALDPALDVLRRRVAVSPQDRAPGTLRVEVDLHDGRGLGYDVPPVFGPVADDALAAEWEALQAKADMLVTPVLGSAATAEVVAIAASLEDASVSDVVTAATPRG